MSCSLLRRCSWEPADLCAPGRVGFFSFSFFVFVYVVSAIGIMLVYEYQAVGVQSKLGGGGGVLYKSLIFSR